MTGFFPRPPLFTEAYSLQINANVFEGLVRFDEHLRLQPALALRWESPDPRTQIFDLRPGARFSDGRPATAADVAASLLAAVDQDWPTHDYLKSIESVRVLSPTRLEVRTRRPDLVLLYRLYAGFVIPADATTARDPAPAVGTGPYRLERWQAGQAFVLGPNPHYYGPRPDFERATFEVVPDDTERVGRVLRGEADVADHVPPARIAELRKNPAVRLVARTSLRVLFLGMRVDAPPLADPRVREALELSIDRAELVARALQGHGEPASQVVPRAVVGFNPRLPLTLPDRDRARQLLAQAGHGAGLELRLEGPNNRYVNDTLILSELARQLEQGGFRVAVSAMDKAAFFQRLRSGPAPLFLLGWSCESGDAGNVLDMVFHSPRGGLGSMNFTGLQDARLDELIEAGNEAAGLRERTALLQEALARLRELRAAVPLLVQSEAVLLSRRVEWEPPVNMALQLAAFKRAR